MPSATLLYHGTKDNIVAYNKVSIFRKGMYGTKSLVKTFEKNDYPYMVVRYDGMRHRVSPFPRFEVQDQICDFMDRVVADKYHNELDITIKDNELLEKYK